MNWVQLTGPEGPVLVNLDQVMFVVPCPDKAHGSHLIAAAGALAVSEKPQDIARLMPAVTVVPPGMVN